MIQKQKQPVLYNALCFQAVSLGVGDQAEMWICFHPPNRLDLSSYVLDEVSLLVVWTEMSFPVVSVWAHGCLLAVTTFSLRLSWLTKL